MYVIAKGLTASMTFLPLGLAEGAGMLASFCRETP